MCEARRGWGRVTQACETVAEKKRKSYVPCAYHSPRAAAVLASAIGYRRSCTKVSVASQNYPRCLPAIGPGALCSLQSGRRAACPLLAPRQCSLHLQEELKLQHDIKPRGFLEWPRSTTESVGWVKFQNLISRSAPRAPRSKGARRHRRTENPARCHETQVNCASCTLGSTRLCTAARVSVCRCGMDCGLGLLAF